MLEIITQRKRCSVCKEIKPLTDFYKQHTGKFGRQAKCKKCCSEYQRQWKSENHEKVKSWWQSWYAANRERELERKRKYHAEHKDQEREYDRDYRNANRETIRERGRRFYYRNIQWWKDWYKKNKQRVRERSQKWEKSNPDKVRAKTQNRRARIVNSGGRVTEKEWQDLKRKYNYTCLCCKRREPEISLTLDHVKPLDKGGRHNIGNIQPLCLSCNDRKGTKHIDYR